jgi:hypothetical protein
MKIAFRALLVLMFCVGAPLHAEVRLASHLEVHAVGVYEGSTRTGETVHGPEVVVKVDRPATSVILMLGSYENVRWKLDVAGGTSLTRVILHGNGARQSEVWVGESRRLDVEFSDLPYAYASKGEDFRAIVAGVTALTGEPELTSFTGAYAAGELPFLVNSQSARSPELQADYLAAHLLAADRIPAALRPLIAELAQPSSQRP